MRFFRSHRWIVALTAAAGVCLLLIGAYTLVSSRTWQTFGRIVPRVETREKVVALTFDDGPTPLGIDSVLPMLQRRGVRATFFVTGAETERHPDLARRLVAAGEELGNHTWSHPRMLLKPPAFIRGEIERTDLQIRAAGYHRPILFRPPFGKKGIALPLYLSRHGRTTVTWDVEPDSYAEVAATPEGIVRHVLERTRPGSIILLHVMYPSRATSRAAVPGIVDGLRARGYRFVTVSEMVALGHDAG
ncbi:MAG TPA: polysaccharide deacetylase family protein [Longimicrobiaceae bacterium]|jgi:peptidoglycan/xylan/chitin deacetylase (PgdA/CDA1 family)|nr:polysaccharide deacetylase family protein [Longimicrobiaceae bacterium]